jgi:IclR family transcriptional regulator, acetate operon repressor
VTKTAPYPISSVDNALRLLTLFRDKRPIRVSEAAATLGVARSTAHRLLSTLEQHGFARRDPATRTYLPGPVLAELGLATAGLELLSATRADLEQLSAETGETTHLVILEGSSALFLDSVETSKALRIGSRVGAVMAAHCTSAGKAMLALLSADELSALYPRGQQLEQMTPNSIATREALDDELEAIRKRGYAINRDESEIGVSAVAKAFRAGPTGRVAAFSVSVPSTRFDAARVAEIAKALERAVARSTVR